MHLLSFPYKVVRRQTMQYSDLMQQQRLLSPVVEGKQDVPMQQKVNG